MNQGAQLGEFVEGRIYCGIKTGLNKAFVIDRYKRDELVDADPRSAEIIKPWLRGRDIKRWKPDWAQRYIVFTRRRIDIDAYPAVRDHLERFRHPTFNANGKLLTKGLEPRGGAHWRKRGAYQWYEVQDTIAYYQELEHPKIVWPDIAREVRFAYDTEASYLDMTCFTIPTESRWLLALLNSDLGEFLLCQITSSLRHGFLRPKRHWMNRLPIVTPAPALRRRLESIAQAGIAGEPVDTDELNDIVNHLYNLTPADISLINTWFRRRSLTAPAKQPNTSDNP